jgi:methylglutaconyl-CoA hydratase
MNYTTIELDIENNVATIWLNRPEVRNALNNVILDELVHAFKYIRESKEIYFVILRGKGNVFCSGADIHWMKKSGSLNYKQNLKESSLLAKCIYELYNLPQPTAAVVNGAVIGGGLGLMCAADIVMAIENTVFSLSEVRIGLVPSIIMPFILTRINEHKLLLYTSTAKKINTEIGLNDGLIDLVYTENNYEEKINEIKLNVLKASPSALFESKRLLRELHPILSKKLMRKSVESISKMKMSADGQEGMNAFFDKRTPIWNKLQNKS